MVRQGLLTNTILSNVLSNIPRDPKTNNWYWYGTTANRQQFQIGLTLENNGSPKAMVIGEYKSIAKNLFPTLLLAVTGATSFDVNVNTGKFIINGGSFNLPYDMNSSLVASGSNLNELLSES